MNRNRNQQVRPHATTAPAVREQLFAVDRENPPADSPAGHLRIALGGDPSTTFIERATAIRQLRDRLAEEEAQIAFAMRLGGHAWQEIADVFEISRQAAHQKFVGARTLDKLGNAAGRTPGP